MRPGNIFDYMEDLTGVDEAALREAVSLQSGLRSVHAVLNASCLLVGWGVQNDIEWLNLVEGQHYARALDIMDWFVVPGMNRETGEHFQRRFPLGHVAYVLLGMEMRIGEKAHDPNLDASATLKLYHKFCARTNATDLFPFGLSTHCESGKIREAMKKVASVKIDSKHRSSTEPTPKGVCRSAYDPSKCVCGKASKRKIDVSCERHKLAIGRKSIE
jgi:hypothetical protein